MKEGYDTANLSPNQVTLKGSFDTNNTGVPDGIRGRFDVTRTGAGVFRIKKALDSNNAPAATYTQWEHYDVSIHGTNSSNYTIRVTGEDGNDAQPYIDVTVYLRTYAVGAIDTYVATDTTDLKICFEGTLLQA